MESNFSDSDSQHAMSEALNMTELIKEIIINVESIIQSAPATGSNEPQSQALGRVLDEMMQSEDQAPPNKNQDQSQSDAKITPEVIENYIQLNLRLCELHHNVIKALKKTKPLIAHDKTDLIGIANLAINIISKKSLQIVVYFIGKFEGDLKVTNMGQSLSNEHKEKYLEEFKKYRKQANTDLKESAELSKKNLPDEYPRREEQVECLNIVPKIFIPAIMKDLVHACRRISETVASKEPSNRKLISYLAVICRYQDTVIFKAKHDNFQNLKDELEEINEKTKFDDELFKNKKEQLKKWDEQTGEYYC